jgi:hypothetical protein
LAQTNVAIILVAISFTDKKLIFVVMLKRTFFTLLVIAFFVSCHNKLEILAPYKQSVSVYGLLNQDDSVNYIRIERVYLGAGNALQMATVQDSVWFKPGELKVSLHRIRNGAVIPVDNTGSVMEIVLNEANITTDPGLFNVNELAYKTTHRLYDDSQYQLFIHNNHTDKDFTTDPISLVGDFSQKMLYIQEGSIINPSYSSINVIAQGGESICRYQAPTSAGVCGLKMLFYYTDSTYTGVITPRTLEVDLGTQYTEHLDGSDKIDLTFSDDVMLDYFINHIGPATSPIHHRTADSIKFVLNGGGADVALYNDISSTTTLAQNQPTYTNIKGGVGIFSSRRQYVLRKKISAYMITRLATWHYCCPLKFYGNTHQFELCQ